MIPFTFVIPEKLLEPCLDNQLHNRLPPSFEGNFYYNPMNINKYFRNHIHHYSISRPNNRQQKFYGSLNLKSKLDNFTRNRSHMCRTSAADALTNNFKQDILRQYNRPHINVSNTYYFEARIENCVTLDNEHEDTQQIKSMTAYRSFKIVPSYPALSPYLLQSYLDMTKYISATNIYGTSNDSMKYKTIHYIDSKTGKLYFYKHFKWLAGKPKIFSTIKVITPRPDPILFSPDTVPKGIYDLSLNSKVHPKGSTSPSGYLVYPMKFIYTPRLIDGVPEAPPLITSVEPHLQVHTTIAMSELSLNTYKDLRECPLEYKIRDATNDIVGRSVKFDTENILKLDGFSDSKLGYKEDIHNWNGWIAHYDPKTDKTIYEKVLNIEISFLSSYLVPNFETCYLSRFYEMEFKIELKPQTQVPNINVFKKALMKIQAICVHGSNTNKSNADYVESLKTDVRNGRFLIYY